jgi:serine/threonine-protein kinase
MSLVAGTRLGPYEILAPLGEGGMGEVYKARDTRLGRTVAIKALPGDAATDLDATARAGRRARIEREARLLSALNHPHICVLHDIGAVNGFDYLVMECLEGHTLADRLTRRGRLPLGEALDCGIQIADALAAAHREGIVHRDLKPENVMLTKTGVKVLDFGIARVIEAAKPAVGTAPVLGTVHGTLPYVAPEQLHGGPVDPRTDLFAFGAVLHEMLTGARAFEGGSPAAVVAAILEHEPRSVAAVDPSIPPAVDRLVTRCLAKNPDARWQTAADLGAELRWLRDAGAGGSAAAVLGRPGRPAWGAALAVAGGLVMALAGAGVMWLLRPAPAIGSLTHPSLDVGPADELNAGGENTFWLPTPGGSRTAFAWTPDGQALVFVGRRGGVQQLYVRRLDAPEARMLVGTEGAQAPAVSPDGKWVAFWARRAIRKVPIGGGPATELAADVQYPPRGQAWGDRGRLYFSKEPDGTIWQVPADEGAPSVVPAGGAPDAKRTLPWPLPGERALLYTVRTRQYTWGYEEVVAFTLATRQPKVLLKDASDARYLSTGHLVFLRRGTLFAVPFDIDRLEVHGAPVAVLETVAHAQAGGHAGDATGAGQFAVAPTGTLAWLPGQAAPTRQSELVTVDRRGHVSSLRAPARFYGDEVRPSPDGRQLAVTIRTLTEEGVWLYDLGRETLTPLVRGGDAYAPVWSPDGQRLLFSWFEGGQLSLVSQPADVSAPPRVLAPGRIFPTSFAPDGRRLAAVTRSAGEIVIATLDNGQAQVQPLLQVPHGDRWPAFSPDGRWLAYGSNVSGRDEVYVRAYPGPGPAKQVTVESGHSPAWRPDGKELFFVRRSPGPPAEYSMMAVAFRAGPPVTFGQPTKLFAFNPRDLALSCAPVRCYDVAPDGQRFYAVQHRDPPPPPVVTHVNLIMNWFEELKTKVPVSK